MYKLYYNEKPIPDFVIITKIEEPLIGDITNTVISSNYGSKYKKTEFGTKIVKVYCTVKKGFKMLMDINKITELNEWLKGDNWKATKLVLPGRDYYYEAIVNNAPDLEPNNYTANFEIDFLILNPDRINLIEYESSNMKINYMGTSEEVYPTIILKVTNACSELKLSVSNSKYNNYMRLKHNFLTDDEIIIDMKTKKITVNNIVKMQILTLDSRFHKLAKGENIYTLNTGNADVKIKYRNRYI